MMLRGLISRGGVVARSAAFGQQQKHQMGLRSLRNLNTFVETENVKDGEGPDLVTVTKKDGVAIFTLNNPTRLNALDVRMGDQFKAAVRSLDCSDIGCVVLTGEGRAFSAGGDFQFLRDRHHDTPSRNAQIMRGFYERFLSLRELPVPIIAAVNGHAIGAGLCVALACDLRIVAGDAKLGVTFAKLGLHPGMGSTHFLPKLVGQQESTRMLLTGDLISGKRAVEIGMALEAVPSSEVLKRAVKLAKSIASGSPLAVRSCARTLRMTQDEGLDRALWREADAQAACYASLDLAEGVDAIAEGRPPSFHQYEGYEAELHEKLIKTNFTDE